MPRKKAPFHIVTANSVPVRYLGYYGLAVFMATDIARALGYTMSKKTPGCTAVGWRGRPGHVLVQLGSTIRSEHRVIKDREKGRHMMTAEAVYYVIESSRRIHKDDKPNWIRWFQNIARGCQDVIASDDRAMFLDFDALLKEKIEQP
jgi:hypothetical protein